MTKNDKRAYLALTIFAIFVLAGFYLMFDRIANLREDFKNFELSFELSKKEIGKQLQARETVKEQENLNPPPAFTEETAMAIPTAILFQAKSSSSSEPRNDLSLSVDNILKKVNGAIEISVKVFNGGLGSSSALDPVPLFKIINPEKEGEDLEPYKIEGSFDTILPKNAILGKIFFKIPSSQNLIILQVGSTDNLTFYEINFSKKTYKEITLG